MPDHTRTPEVQPHPVVPANLNSALHAFQAECIIITKNTEGQEGNRRYKYADYAAIMRDIQPALTRHGLSVTQACSIRQGLCTVHTQVRHVSGETLDADTMEWPAHDIKEAGANITYMRRYSLCAALNIVIDEADADATSLPQRPQPQAVKPAAPVKIPLRTTSAVAQSVPQSPAAEKQPPFMEKGKGDFKVMVDAITGLKQVVGEHYYYSVLKHQGGGVKHANELRISTPAKRAEAVRVWHYLNTCALIVNMQERIGSQEFNRVIGGAGYCNAQEIATLPEMKQVLQEMQQIDRMHQRQRQQQGGFR